MACGLSYSRGSILTLDPIEPLVEELPPPPVPRPQRQRSSRPRGQAWNAPAQRTVNIHEGPPLSPQYQHSRARPHSPNVQVSQTTVNAEGEGSSVVPVHKPNHGMDCANLPPILLGPATQGEDLPGPRAEGGQHTVRFALNRLEDSSSGEEFDFVNLPETPSRLSINSVSNTSPTLARSPHTPNRAGAIRRTPIRVQTSGTPRRRGTPSGTPRRRGQAAAITPLRRIQGGTRRRAGTSGGRRAKDVWEFFPGDGRCCSFCENLKSQGQQIPFNDYQSSGTDDRRKHLARHHLKAWIEYCVASNIPLTSEAAKRALQEYRTKYITEGHLESNPEVDTDAPVYSKEAMVDAIMYHIIADDESIEVIESPFFRTLIRTLRNDLKDSDIPKADSMRQRIEEALEEYLDKLKQEIHDTAEGDVQCTDDIWTDSRLRPFLAVTGHWIQAIKVKTLAGIETTELVYRSDLIGFCLGLINKIGHITSDNASNNDTFMSELANMLADEGRVTEWNPEDRQIRCFAHIVNLSCKSVLAMMDEIGDNVMHCVRVVIREIRSSGLRRDYFSWCTERVNIRDLQLLLDIDIRWSSTYIMINRALVLRPALSQFFTNEDYRHLHTLSADDWVFLKDIRDVLEVPHLFQQRLSAQKTPTLCWALPSFAAMVEEYKSQMQRFPYLTDVIQAGIDKLNNYYQRLYNIPAYILAMVLNPEAKLSFYNDAYDRDHAKSIFIDAVKSYRGNDAENVLPEITELTFAERFLRGQHEKRTRPGISSVEDEVNLYLAESCSEPVDLLGYWKDNKKRYPTIYKLAMDILPIQGTSVPCERVFSSAKHTLTDRRTSMSTHLVEALQILKFALKSQGGNFLDFTAHYAAEAEVKHLEASTHDQYSIPSYMKAFLDL
ncbi:hypothetical protein D9757_011237 [Collybiopsis confluens]|uniref:HAT C-terminal dimerisation domain-containing protein n=1 Tax=Collybiopsis confluens TaxID=2823264 RepID=A0A8H5GNI2_9AGAR|nr:hypothetical protein D9757_011237 [Collybiopsis confluens]